MLDKRLRLVIKCETVKAPNRCTELMANGSHQLLLPHSTLTFCFHPYSYIVSPAQF